MKRIMDGNEACSYVSYKFTELAGIYPITPASTMAENSMTYAALTSAGKEKYLYALEEGVALK